ncbi:UNVERIFIED_CONTAM: hypothetical protein PYX00_011372 [Menopon gallinae]|uniref:TRM5/TYW2-like N-terminal domain-containing protein n=1 Tax=Menopon gallinae TaxID=328185 RepID=A0AAW2H7E3_9NEOP
MLCVLRSSILSVPRIPPVLDTERAYTGFDIICTPPLSEQKKIILLDANKSAGVSSAIPVKLVLKYEYFTYKEILSEMLPARARTPASFQVVGKILHLNLKDEQLEFRKVIGAVLLDKARGNSGQYMLKTTLGSS